jgi:hypothetical protein
MSGTTWRKPGCFSGFFIIALAALTGGVISAFAATWLPGAGGFYVWLGSTIVLSWGGFRLFRAATTKPAYWCPHCGVRTHPGFPICSRCGQNKGYEYGHE